MGDFVFVDTNIWIYSLLEDGPNHQKRLQIISLLEPIISNVCISTQVVNELYVALQKNKLSLSLIESYLDVLFKATHLIVVNEDQIRKAWQIKSRYGFSYWDSLMVASAMQNNCEILFTEDLQHGQTIGHLKIVNPFLG